MIDEREIERERDYWLKEMNREDIIKERYFYCKGRYEMCCGLLSYKTRLEL